MRPVNLQPNSPPNEGTKNLTRQLLDLIQIFWGYLIVKLAS